MLFIPTEQQSYKQKTKNTHKHILSPLFYKNNLIVMAITQLTVIPMNHIAKLNLASIVLNLKSILWNISSKSLLNSKKAIFKSLSVTKLATSLTGVVGMLLVSTASPISNAIRVSPHSFLNNLILLFLNSTTLNIGMQPFKGLTHGT